MNFNFAAFGGFRARLRKTLLFAMILINLLGTGVYAQNNLTRNQFSRFRSCSNRESFLDSMTYTLQ